MRDISPSSDIAVALIVNSLFTDLMALFPAFRVSFCDDEILGACKRQWTLAFIENHVTDAEQVKIGLKACRKQKSPFFPSVGQFIDWCNPSYEDEGFLPVNDAYVLCVAMCRQFDPIIPDKERDRLILSECIRQIGRHRFRHLTEKEARSAFLIAYPDAIIAFKLNRLVSEDRCLKNDSDETAEIEKRKRVVKAEHRNMSVQSLLDEIRRKLA